MAMKEAQSQDNPPQVEAGKRAVWHKEYKYTNSKGTEITIRGHWEVIDLPKEKPKAQPAPVEEPKAEAPAEEPKAEKPKAKPKK